MGYKLDIDDWLEQMVGKSLFGCVDIPEGDLPLSNILLSWFNYTADDPFEHIFNVPLEDKTEELVLYARGSYGSGRVTLLTTEITRFGFTVKAPIDCRVDFIIGYKND